MFDIWRTVKESWKRNEHEGERIVILWNEIMFHKITEQIYGWAKVLQRLSNENFNRFLLINIGNKSFVNYVQWWIKKNVLTLIVLSQPVKRSLAKFNLKLCIRCYFFCSSNFVQILISFDKSISHIFLRLRIYMKLDERKK